MAEPISSILTVTTVSLAIIRETAIFIRDAKEVDTRIHKLLSRLENLRDWIESVESECKVAASYNEIVPENLSVALKRARTRLEEIQKVLEKLASRKSGTFYQKVKLKIRTEESKREILEANEDLKHYKGLIKNCIAIWTHQRTASIDRRMTEVLPTPQIEYLAQSEGTRAFDRTLSNASTVVFEPSFVDTVARGTSLFTAPSHDSRSSISSGALHSPVERSDSAFSNGTGVRCAEERDHSDDLHYQIRVHKSSETKTQIVRRILQRHQQSSDLVNTRDEYGRTPLCLSARLGDTRMARMLVLEFSADINVKDDQPFSVLDHAVSNNREAIVAFLIDQGVDEQHLHKRNRNRLDEIKATMEFRKKKTTSVKQKGKPKRSVDGAPARLLTT